MRHGDYKSSKNKPQKILKKIRANTTKRSTGGSGETKEDRPRPKTLPKKDQYLTEKKVAELTGFSVKYLQKLRHRGEGPPYIKIGRSIRYKWSDVVKWMDSHRVER